MKVEVAADFEMGVTNKTPAFTAKFPLGKVPAMETADGPLTESDAIALYVASSVKDSPLVGKTNYDKALIQQYVSFASNELGGHISKWYYPLVGISKIFCRADLFPDPNPSLSPSLLLSCRARSIWFLSTPGGYNKEVEKNAKDAVKRALVALDTELLHKTFLVGQRISLADISVACHVLTAYKELFDAEFRAAFPNVTRWFLTVVNQPKFKGVVGEVALAKTMMVYDGMLSYDRLHAHLFYFSQEVRCQEGRSQAQEGGAAQGSQLGRPC